MTRKDIYSKQASSSQDASETMLLSEADAIFKELNASLNQRADKLEEEMLQRRRPTEWREHLGDDRKRIGDFACYLALFYALNSR